MSGFFRSLRLNCEQMNGMVFGRAWCLLALGGLLTLIMVPAHQARAAQVASLYKTEVEVDSQGQDDRQKALARALEQVLVNVTGETRALANDRLQKGIRSPEAYVKGYSYRREAAPAALYLQVTFDEGAVNRLLRDAGMAIWGATRPTTLTWLAVDAGNGREIQKETAGTPLVEELRKHFASRALPLVFPLMDFQDAQMISAGDVWGLFTERLEEVSQRYSAQSILAGRITLKDGVYSGRLSHIFRGQRQEADITDLDLEQLEQAAADLVGSALARHYAVAPAEAQGESVLIVDKVSSLKDYAALQTYLEKLTAVRDMQVLRRSGDELELKLSIDGQPEQLADAIALGRKLKRLRPPRVAAAGAGSGGLAGVHAEEPVIEPLYYRWLGRS